MAIKADHYHRNHDVARMTSYLHPKADTIYASGRVRMLKYTPPADVGGLGYTNGSGYAILYMYSYHRLGQ